MRKPIPKLPKKPTAGNPVDTILSSSWWTRLWNYLLAIQPLYPDNLTIIRNMNGTISARRPTGSSASSDTTGGGTGSYPCQITGGSTATGYTCNIYADGKNQPSTGSGTIEVLEMMWGDNIPIGTWVVGHSTTVIVTGGTTT